MNKIINSFLRIFKRFGNQSQTHSFNPWAGLSSYEDPENTYHPLQFYGRSEETKNILDLIESNLLVTLYGKSGIGKTSVLNAGVFPELRKKNYFPIYLRLGVNIDTESVSKCIISEITKTIESKFGSASIKTIEVVPEIQDSNSNDYLWSYFSRHKFYNKDGETIFPVLVFDQFEEFLRSNRSDTVFLLKQIAFMNDKNNAIRDCKIDDYEYSYDYNFRFVLSIREDDIYLLEDVINIHYLSCLKSCRFRLQNLTENGAKEIVICNGQKCIDPNSIDEVSDRIIEASKTNNDGMISTNVLSLICTRLYDVVKRNGRVEITNNDVKEYLKKNPFEEYYLDAVRDLTEKEKIFIEKNLITSDGRRTIISENDLYVGIKSPEKLFNGDTKILHRIPSEDKSNHNVELLHDGLCGVVQLHKSERVEKQCRTIYGLWLLLFGIIGLWIIDQSVIEDIAHVTSTFGLKKCITYLLSGGSLIGIAELLSILIAPVAIGACVFSLSYRKKIANILIGIYIIPFIFCYKFFYSGLFYFYENVKDTELLTACMQMSDRVRGFFIYSIVIIALIAWNYLGQNGAKSKDSTVVSILTNRITIIYYWVIAVFLFLYSIFGEVAGVIKEYHDPIWGLILIPLITLFFFDFKFFSKFVWLAAYLALLIGYVMSIYLNWFLPYQFVIIFLIVVFFVLIGCYYQGKIWSSINKSLCNIFVLTVLIIACFDYNPKIINNKNIVRVYPWSLVLFSSNDKIGILDAVRGDTLLVPDFKLSGRYGLSLHSSKYESFNLLTKSQYKSLDNISSYPFIYNDTVHELRISNILYDKELSNIAYNDRKTKNDDLDKTAVRTFFKIRNDIVKYTLTNDSTYFLSDLDTLYVLSDKVLRCLIESMDIMSKNDSCLSEPIVANFTSNLTKCLYVNNITEALLNDRYEDFYLLFSSFYLPVILPDALPYEKFIKPFSCTVNFDLRLNSNIVKKEENKIGKYSLYIDWSDINKNKLYAVNDLFDVFFTWDYSESSKKFEQFVSENVNSVQKKLDSYFNYRKSTLSSLKQIHNELTKSVFPDLPSSLDTPEEKEKAIKIFTEYLTGHTSNPQNRKNKAENLKNKVIATVDSDISHTDSIAKSVKELVLMNISQQYEKLLIEVNPKLIQIIRNQPNNPYAGYIKGVCEKLYALGVVRGYDMKDFTKEVHDLSANVISPYYTYISEVQDAINSMNSFVEGFQMNVNNNNKELREKTETIK